MKTEQNLKENEGEKKEKEIWLRTELHGGVASEYEQGPGYKS